VVDGEGEVICATRKRVRRAKCEVLVTRQRELLDLLVA
jgi:hypothetical protein